MMTSGLNPTSVARPTWYVAPRARTRSGLGPDTAQVQHVHVQAVLPGDQRRQQADGPRAGHEHVARFPEGPLPDGLHLLPRLGHDRGGFEQHAEETERAVDLHGVLRLDSPLFGHEAVDLLDAALRVLAVAAHVPFTHSAVRTGHGVGTAHDADDQVTFLQAAGRARLEDPAERFVPEHQPRPARRRPSVLAFDDLDVRSADADRDGFDEHRPFARVWLGYVLETGAPRVVWFDGNGLHVCPFPR